MMKTLIALLALTGIISLASTQPAVAIDPFAGACSGNTAASSTTICKDKQSDDGTAGNPVSQTILRAVTIIAVLTGVAAVIIIIVAGISYIISAGDPAKVAAAKNTIIYAAIGLVVVTLARTIIAFVINRL